MDLPERNSGVVGKGRETVAASLALPPHRRFALIAFWLQGLPQRTVTIEMEFQPALLTAPAQGKGRSTC